MSDLNKTKQMAAAQDRCLNCGSSSLTWGRLGNTIGFLAEGVSRNAGVDPVWARRCEQCKNIQLFEVEYGTRPVPRAAPDSK